MADLNRGAIEAFLEAKRFAFVGVSRDARDFSRHVFRAFAGAGYEPVPVNPHASEIEGQPSYRTVGEIAPPVDAVFVMTPPAGTLDALERCGTASIRRVWLFRGAGQGAVSPEVVRLCEERGWSLVAGECPLMFLPGAGWLHRIHRFFRHPGY
ncbi:MAG: CoA-binding protein [Bryobacterales bacterium]|jgi:uncharacterized protein|nr:CoA-binding protein [Bryobacterales bacterium]